MAADETIDASGNGTPSLLALAEGGTGGAGGDLNVVTGGSLHAGEGGPGGEVDGEVNAALTGSAPGSTSASTSGDTSPGIYALSLGGMGGEGGYLQAEFGEGTGGFGGAGGDTDQSTVSVVVTSASIATQGLSSPGIVAQSEGGAGGDGNTGTSTVEIYGGDGGDGGAAGQVTATTDAGSAITTTGSDSIGILAQSLGGAAGAAGAGGGATDNGGTGGTGGDAGDVTVTNNGTISTTGQTARGIVVQSLAGGGGSGGAAWGLFHSSGGSGAAGGTSGTVAVDHGGSITTAGSNAHGVLLQSIGGGGGAGGAAGGPIAAVGGSGSFAAEGGAVDFTASGGSIATSGISAIGVLGQSVGGGGGDGGGAESVAVSVGGSGGAAGDGGPVTAMLGAGSQISTTGDLAAAVIMQSVGGGGGNAGNASSDGLFASLAVGGSGGNGNVGGVVQLNTSGTTISTAGSKAPGLVVQSVGGGGGSGGAALAGSVGAAFSVTVGVGGSGGTGADGGPAAATLTSSSISSGQNSILVNGSGSTIPVPCTQTASRSRAQSSPCNGFPVDSHGVLVQSIGGGGGLGGSAMAQSITIATPVTGDGDQVALSAAISVGGKGNGGGDGGNAQFSLSNGSTITTYGQGSVGAMVQSVGGGGGAGGDSSATAAAIGWTSNAVPDNTDAPGGTIAFSVGGAGGVAGNGGAVQVALGGAVSASGSLSADPAGSAPTSIVTYGDYADGLMAQSIGGGGGNAGAGSGNTQGFGTGSSSSFTFTLGSTGGAGGEGGTVEALMYAGNGITTHGSGAVGMLAQSIGGGGGASQGGSLSVAQSFKPPAEGSPTVKPGVTINLGTNGSSGGNGGNVTVLAQAPITTLGGDATGMLAQSIGGGGGLGGSAGSDASADNPFVRALAGREWQSEVNSYLNDGSTPQYDPTLAVSIGGAGGTGGAGGSVTAYLEAPITTSGDWASGIVAQSIGGGGGKGGTSIAHGSGGVPEVTVNLDYALGGRGGSGGDGGSATVTLEPNGRPAVTTAGYGAAGVIVQSIGGGGGIGSDGSDSATGSISVGGTTTGGGGGSGNGGNATFNYNAAATIATTGDVADGVVLQSIGGGGGMAGAGSSLGFNVNGTLALTVGGGPSASGNADYLKFGPNSGTDNPLTISTTGYNSFGILAQSIGGGGGVISTTRSNGASSQTTEIGGLGSGNGNAVYLTLGGQSVVTTTGIGANGIVAQSIGGGGGIVRVVGYSSDVPDLAVGDDLNTPQTKPSAGNGGFVDIEIDGTIKVTGAGAIGLFAQSIGGGGGYITNGDGMYAGAPMQYGYSCSSTPCGGTGDDVTVDVSGSVSATGENGIGVFAQTAGYGVNGQVFMTVEGTVTGGSGSGSAAIVIDSPAGANGNQLQVSSGGTVTTVLGRRGFAVDSSGGYTNVVNDGTIVGIVDPGGLNGEFINRGAYFAGPDLRANLRNSGIVNLGMIGESALSTTRITGDFIQTESGRLEVLVDSLSGTANRLQVDGAASLAGVVAPTAVTLLPGMVPVITAGRLNSTASGLDSLLFRWDTAPSGNTLSLAPRPDFSPSDVPLTDSQASLARYYGRAWDLADSALATQFAAASRITDGAGFRSALDTWSSKATHAQSIELANSAGTILGSAMSCPVFVDQNVLLGEDECLWARVTGRWTDQEANGDTQGYDVSSTTYRIGAQHMVAPNWYLGASLAAGQTWANMDGGSSGSGDTYDGSVTLKHVMGPWQVAGSIALASGSFDTNRRVSNLGTTESVQGDPSIFLAGGRLRAGYQFSFDGWYVRPYGDVDLVYTNLPGFEETGSSPNALDVRSSNKTSVALSPMVEIGGRLDLDQETTIRPYAAIGVSYIPDNTRRIDSSFVGASSASGTFSDYIESPELLGKIDVGLQLFRAGGFEVKAGYTAEFGDSFLSQTASGRLAYHF